MMIRNNLDKRLLSAIADYQKYRQAVGALSRVKCSFAKTRHEILSILGGSDISRESKIDRSVRMPHMNGIVIHQEAIIGADCLIMQQVTIGQTATPGAPTLGRNVYAGSGAKILGEIKVGDNARIGANAVVVSDVPPDTTVIGIPAKAVNKR